MDGVYGTVRQLGKAPQEYAVALSTAAGGRMQNVVCESDQVAADGIRYLKDNSLGRATFLPLNKLRAPELPPLKNRDIIDYAVNLLDYDPLYDVVFRYIFGTTVVVKDLNTARKMIGQYRMVTLAGDIVEKAGAMTGGSQNRNLAMFGVSADNEIENIRAEMAKLSQEQSTLESAVARLTDEGDKKRNRRKEIADTRVEFCNRVHDLSGRRSAGQDNAHGLYSDSVACLMLHPHIHLGCGVVAHDDGCQTGGQTRVRNLF